MSASRSLELSARLGAVLLLTAVALMAGCGKGGKVTLQAQFSSAEPAGNNGDESGDGWTDNHSTPTGFAMAIQSATLTGSGVSFTIFDKGIPDDALFIRLYNSPTKVTIPPDNNDDLGIGTYDTLELKVVFYETAIEVVDATDSRIRRLRTYFQNYHEPLIGVSPTPTVTAHDQLISDSDMTVPAPSSETDADYTALGAGGRDLRWINPIDGSRCSTRTDCEDAGTPYLVDMTHFPTDYPTVTIGIPHIVVDSSTDANFIITLTTKIQNLFFYDETDPASPADTLFNYLNTSSMDGKINAACSDPNDCANSDPQQADFGIGPPNFSATVTEQ